MAIYSLREFDSAIQRLNVTVLRLRIYLMPSLIAQRESWNSSLQGFLIMDQKVMEAKQHVDMLINLTDEYRAGIRVASFDNFQQFSKTDQKQHRAGQVGSLNDKLQRLQPHLKDLRRQLDRFVKDSNDLRLKAREEEVAGYLDVVEYGKTDPYEHFVETVQGFDLLVFTIFLLVSALKKK